MPKKRKTNGSQSHYDPRYAEGYAILNNLSAAQEALGNVLQAYREAASRMDAEVSRRTNRQRAEQDKKDIERKKLYNLRTQELKNQIAELDPTSKNSWILGQNAQYDPSVSIGGAFALYEAQRLNDARKDMPMDYGLSDFFSDQWNSLLREMNKNQADEAVGLQVRAANDKALIKDYNDSLDKLDEIDSIDFRLGQINDISRKGLTRGQLKSLNDEINQLVSRKHQLQEEYKALAPRRKQLEETVNRSNLSAALDRTLSGNGIFGSDAWWNPAGKTTAIHDELNDARRFLYDLGNGNRSRQETRAQLLRAIQEYDNLNKGWNAVIEENRAALEQYDKKVTGWFKGRESRANIEFFDPDTYLFKLPGILGGSASSYMKQIPAMAAGIVAGIVAAPMVAATAVPTVAGGVATLAAGMGTSFAFNQGAGRAENNVEVANSAIDVIKNRTGLNEKDIRDLLSGKLTDPKKLRKVTENIKSVENLFNTDMAATTWDSAIDAALSVVPVGALSKLTGFAKTTAPVKKVLANPRVQEALSSRFGSDFAKGYKYTDVTGPVGGVVGGLANATLGRTAKAATSKLGNFVVRPVSGKLGKLAESIGKKVSGLGKAVTKVDPAEVAFKKSLKNGTRTKYLKDISGRLVKSAISEGIEEGKQHINSENFKAGAMDPEVKSVFDIALNDFCAGYTSGAYMLGIPLDGIGLIDIKDQDMLEELKGGMLGGWAQTTAVNVIQDVAPYIQEQRANEIVAEAVLRKKLESLAKYEQYQHWIKNGLLRPGYGNVKESFDKLREINNTYKQTNGEEGIAESLIDDAERDYKRVISIAQDPLTKKQAEAQGINVRTLTDPSSWRSNDEYRRFVALKAIADGTMNEKRDVLDEKTKEREAVERWVDLKHTDEYDRDVARNIGIQDEVPYIGVLDGVLAIPQTAYAGTVYEGEAGLTKTLARLAALLKCRGEVEKSIELQKDNKNARVKRGLKRYLKHINDQIQVLTQHNEALLKGLEVNVGDGLAMYPNKNMSIRTLQDIEQNLVFNEEEHEELRDAYEQEIKAGLDYLTAEEAYLKLIGKARKANKDGTTSDLGTEDTIGGIYKNLSNITFEGGAAKDTIERLDEMNNADDKFESVIEELYQDDLHDLRAQHLSDENGVSFPTLEGKGITPKRPSRPVLNKNGEQIHVNRFFGKKPGYETFDPAQQESAGIVDEVPGGVSTYTVPQDTDLLYLDRRLADNEYVDEFGMLWEYVDDGWRNPFEEAAIDKDRLQEFDEDSRKEFEKVWSKYTGLDTVPFTSQGATRLIINTKQKAYTNSTTPPSPENEQPAPPATPPITEKDPQEETLDWLDKKLLSDKTKVLDDEEGYHTTGQDYFIEYEGKVVRMSRVHSVKPEQYYRREEDIERKNVLDDLVKNSGTLDDLLKTFVKYKKDYPQFDDVPYVKYLKDNSQLFFSKNPTEENSVELRHTLENVARLIVARTPGPSVYMGNIVDELSRRFFESPTLYDLTKTSLGVDQLFDLVNEYSKRTYRTLFRDYRPTFKDIVDQLREQYEYYTEELGWELRTGDYTWRAQFNDVGWVAGQTDMIGVDKQGLIHVIDFKTSKRTFGEIEKSGVNFATGKTEKSVIVPFKSITDKEGGQVMSPYDDYTNQQTIYAEMVACETGNSVASIELLPFVCKYKYVDSKVAYVESITLEPRIPLTFNEEMIRVLNNPTERTDKVVEDLKNSIAEAQNTLQELYKQFESKIPEEIYNGLSATGKGLVDDVRQFVSYMEPADSTDVDVLLNMLNEITNAIDSFLGIEDLIFQDYATLADRRAAADRDKANTAWKNAHILVDEQGTGVRRATNKRDRTKGEVYTDIDYTYVERDRDFSLATLAPDFITSADIEVYTEGDYIYCDVSYGGKTWKHVNIRTVFVDKDGKVKPADNGQALYKQVLELEKIKKPGQRIVPLRSSMDRTDGRINVATKNGKDVYLPIKDTDLFAGEDILDIEFSVTYGRLGYIDNKKNCMSFDGGPSLPRPIYYYTYPDDVPAPGTFVYIKHLRKDEINKDSTIPIAIDRVKLLDDDVDLILSLLLDPGKLDKPYVIEHNGQAVNILATGRQLANLLVPIIDDESKLDTATAILRNPENPNIIRFINVNDRSAGKSGLGTFDLSSVDGPNGVNALRQILLNRSITERHDVLATRLSADINNLLPFKAIKDFLNLQGTIEGGIKQFKVSSSLSFDLEDFMIKKSSKGVQRQGISGFAYYLKHNLLRTQYAGMRSCNVGIKDVTLEDKENGIKTLATGVNVLPQAPSAAEQAEEIPQGNYEDFLIDIGLNKVLDKESKKGTIAKKKARRHIEEILGDSGKELLTFKDGFLTSALKTSAHIIGVCKDDAITISSYAYPGVEYHEAFHRVFELLMDEKKRDFIYENLAKRIGVQLYDENGKENKDAFRQVAEYAADKYMDYMNGVRMNNIKIPFLTKAWNAIHHFVRTLVDTSNKDLYSIFAEVNKGAYRNLEPNQKNIDRFNRLYGELLAQVEGVGFQHITNREMYDRLKETVVFCLLNGQEVDRTGRNIQEIGRNITKETFKKGIEKLAEEGYDIIGDTTQIPTVGQLAMKELYEKFDQGYIKDDIANFISILSTDFVKEEEKENTENAQGDPLNSSIGEHTRSAYEFSRFDKTTSRVRFFFATIPDATWEEQETTENGLPVVKMVPKYVLNEFGLPSFVPVLSMYNEFLNNFYDVDTKQELMDRLENLAKESPVYANLKAAIENLYSAAYTKKGRRNADEEALLALFWGTIRANKHNFDIARSMKATGYYGKATIVIQPTDANYNANYYPTRWGQMLINGGTPILKVSSTGKLQINPRIPNGGTIFERLSSILTHPAVVKKAENGVQYNDVGIKEWLNNSLIDNPGKVYLKLTVKGKPVYYTNPKDSAQLEAVKHQIVNILNSLGINFMVPELNYMLLNKYGSTDASALAKMFNSVDLKDSMTSFLAFLKNVAPNGKLLTKVYIDGKKVSLEDAYSKFAFVRELANYKYQYRHSRDQLTVLATGNNKFYQISDNNYITDVIRACNKRTQEFDEMKSDRYNFYQDTEHKLENGEIPTYGSLIIETLAKDSDAYITFRNFVGFKTDKRGDFGSDYFEIARREDYVAKASILQNGGIILPTLSDKKSYGYIDGITLPGLNYKETIDYKGNISPFSNLGKLFVIPQNNKSQIEPMLTYQKEVIDRFISYALSEYMSIKKADADLDAMEKDGTKSSEISNYYTKEQGAKFSSLIGVWVDDYKPGEDGEMEIVGETFHSFNDASKSRKKNIEEAEKYFFSKPRAEQEKMIARLLHKQLVKEIETCQKLGLIEQVGNSDNLFKNYKNVGLDSNAIAAIYKSLIAKNGYPKDQIDLDAYLSLATIIYISDISNKAIMSGQEFERVFSGNPSFYKWKYSDDGRLVDRTVDELKRIGGTVSTGANNYMELQDIPEKYMKDGKFTGMYTCAQIDDELIQSPQESDLEQLFRYGELSQALYLLMEDEAITAGEDMETARAEISAKVDAMSIEEIEAALNPTTLDIVNRKVKAAAESYRLQYKKDGTVDDGINVADGAAYISDTMAEMLLRMNGSYSSQVENAFKILREEKPSTILLKHKAYLQILTSVIGSQKYTAFGRRTHPRTGIQVSYYNKMALFPIFKCLATGRLQNIYSKMYQQGIDMLLFDSAVKVGGQGSKPVIWDSFRQTADESDPQNHVNGDINSPLKPTFDEGFEFNTYQQKFIYLRKQLNTDPKEEFMMNVGTQMTKVAMTALLDGRTYYMQDGTELSGTDLRDDIMNAINILSDRGYRTVAKRFFVTDEKGNFLDSEGNVIEDTDTTPSYKSTKKVLDIEKFSKEVRKMMNTKDPDTNILSALQIVEQKDGEGSIHKHLRLPLNAVSNSKWMESILISSINGDVIDVLTTGSTAIQRSVWAMEGSAMFEKRNGSILSDEDMSLSINGGKRLQLVNEEGSMDCVLSVDMVKKMLGGTLPKATIKDAEGNPVWDLVTQKDSQGNVLKDKDGKPLYVQRKNADGTPMVDKNGNPIWKREIRTREMSFDELRNWLIKREIIGPNAKANIMGYRIPTQAGSSIHALRCVDIIPAVNDTVILPAEFTKTTGSDFDIDKLYLSFIQYKVSRKEGDDGKYHQTVTDKFKESDNAYYQNLLLRHYIALKLDWRSPEDHRCRTTHVQHRSIDNDTALLKTIIKDLQKGSTVQPESPYGFYSLSTQTASKDDYITGKIGIGPYALNNNNHILTMMYHVKFKHIPSSIMSVLDLERLDRRTDKNGESIMSWISALINAHVDIAKDPYISKLNVNPFTYNISNLLVRTGLGDKTFYFTTQPIMKALAEAYNNAGSAYLSDPYSSKYTLQQEALDDVAERWFEPLKASFRFNGATVDRLIDVVKQGGMENAELRTSINLHIKELFDKDLKNDAKKESPSLENQLFYYLAYLQFDRYAKALSGLVQYSKIDTKKHGKSVTELLVYEQGFNKTYDTARSDSLFDGEGLSRMLNDSYIGPKTNNAIGLTKEILANQFIQCTPAFLSTAESIVKAIGRGETLSASLFSKVSDALLAAIKSEFFNDTYVPSITNNHDFMHDLVSESTEQLEFKITEKGNVLHVSGDTHYPLSSYVQSGSVIIRYIGQDGKYHTVQDTDEKGNPFIVVSKVLSADDTAHTITIQHARTPMYGRIILQGGRNTIYDRFWRLQAQILTNPKYRDLLDGDGRIKNRLLDMLVSGQTINNGPYLLPGEAPDTYKDAKFVKLFNFIEDKGSSANYIIDAWDALLLYNNADKEAEKTVRDFARDLIVYAFMTSGDTLGFTKMFKYVPTSWREESGYGKFINNRLVEYNLSDTINISIEDVLLNNWFDNELVPTYRMKDRETSASNFMQYRSKINGKQAGFPTVLAALKTVNGKVTPSIDPENAPLVIKIQRNPGKGFNDSQRKYTIFKLHSMAVSKDGVTYPVYVKVNPKGLYTSEKFLITEYGRNDSVALYEQEYTIDEQVLENVYKASTVGEHIKMAKAAGESVYAAIVSGLARVYQQRRPLETSEIQEESPSVTNTENQRFDVNTAEFYSGAAIGSDREWATQSRAMGVKVKDYTTEDFDNLSEAWKNKLDLEYKDVVKELGRRELPIDDYRGKLVRRDMMQADKADAIFAIGTYKTVRDYSKPDNTTDPTKSVHSYKPLVEGGTAYAAHRGLLRGIPVYLFDQNANKWINLNTFTEVKDLTLTQHAAVIGTREINDSGKQAIKEILERTFNNLDNAYASESDTKINIYAGTGENADLSNFAYRPFDIKRYHFVNVEQAFLYGKLLSLKEQLTFDGSKSSKLAAEKVDALMKKVLEAKTGSEARALGKTKITSKSSGTRDIIDFFFNNVWERRSLVAMEMFIKASFEQNPQALQRLLSTGNATLTHTQDNGKWGTEFPRILMKVREELRKEASNINANDLLNESEVGQSSEHEQC